MKINGFDSLNRFGCECAQLQTSNELLITRKAGTMKNKMYMGLKMCTILMCFALIFSSCYYEIIGVSGPNSVEIGDVFQLKITGNAVQSGDGITTVIQDSSLAIQIPDTWSVISSYAIYRPDGTDGYRVHLTENSTYTSYYTAEDGYKVVVLTADSDPEKHDCSIMVYLTILTDTPQFEEDTAEIKVAAGFLNGSNWDYSAPPYQSFFQAIDSSEYIHSIHITGSTDAPFDDDTCEDLKDGDNDGVPDVWDKCYTYSSNGRTAVDSTGCSVGVSSCTNGEQSDGTWVIVFPDPSTVTCDRFWEMISESLNTYDEWNSRRP